MSTFREMILEKKQILSESNDIIYDYFLKLDDTSAIQVANLILKKLSDDELVLIYKNLTKSKNPNSHDKIYIDIIYKKIQPLLKKDIILDNISKLKKIKNVTKIFSKCERGYSSDCHEFVVTLSERLARDSKELKNVQDSILKILGSDFKISFYNSDTRGVTELLIQ